MTIHHTIIKAVASVGCIIRELEDGEFMLTNPSLSLRATGKDPRVLRALAQQWATNDDSHEGYEIDEDGEESEGAGSVVSAKYKAIYKERGNPSHCGDWLAQTLCDLTHNPKGEFDIEAFIAIIELNGILDHDRYARDTPGARGRFRMTCSQRLRKVIRTTGVLRTLDGAIEVPVDA